VISRDELGKLAEQPVPAFPAVPAPPGAIETLVTPAAPALGMTRSHPEKDAKDRADVFFLDAQKAQKFVKDRAEKWADLMDKTVGRKVTGREMAQASTVKQTTLFELPPLDMLAYKHVRNAIPQAAPLVVREYAAPRPGSAEAHGETPDTVLWQPVIVLPSDGKAKLAFHLGSAAGYEVIVAGHTPDGRIGAVRGPIPVARPEQSAAGPPVTPSPTTVPGKP
jgi:hypothetical protein